MDALKPWHVLALLCVLSVITLVGVGTFVAILLNRKR